jgi:hypothetical protein
MTWKLFFLGKRSKTLFFKPCPDGGSVHSPGIKFGKHLGHIPRMVWLTLPLPGEKDKPLGQVHAPGLLFLKTGNNLGIHSENYLHLIE